MRTGRAAALGRATWLLAVGTTLGCSSLLLPEDPSDDPQTVALSLWSEVDAYYPWFDLKGVDWEAVRDSTFPRVGPETGDDELFDILADMVEVLRDGHVALTSPFGRRSWDGWYAGHPESFDLDVARAYLVGPPGRAAGGRVLWGRLEPGIGYLWIGSFGPGVGEGVAAALQGLDALDGMVVDVRNNGGGSDTESRAAAGRFTDRRVHYRTVRYKAGPGHEDFGPAIEDYLEPAEGVRFTGPVVVLQNRRVFSAGEDFVIAMRERPRVSFVGDTTGGGSGNPIGRELPNGWIASIPRWRLWTADGEVYEGTGLAPDEVVIAPDSELAEGRDATLERALENLSGN